MVEPSSYVVEISQEPYARKACEKLHGRSIASRSENRWATIAQAYNGLGPLRGGFEFPVKHLTDSLAKVLPSKILFPRSATAMSFVF